ncbi:MAG TPA: DUF1003 domain-containing protein [Ktedonobacteraceae bacterium]|nr:DUF1003 domain-containing protein [Ktedonobacteraceae bacterium]
MYITPSGNVANNKVETHLEHKNLLEGIHFKFPTFKHDHPAVVNVNEVADERLTLGQKIADKVAAAMGSWRFIIIQASILAIWIVINTIQLFFKPFDPYPYILLNLALSFQAAFAAPFIMISQNRQAEKDRLMAESDYHCNVKGEEETRNLMDHLDHQDTVLFQLVKRIEEQHEEIMRHLARLDPEMASRLGVDIQEVSKELVEEEAGDSNIAGNS